MPLTLKTFSDFFKSVVGRFNKELPEIDPTIRESLGLASSGSAAAAGVGLQEGLRDGVEQMFWQTADGEFLERIGEYDNTVRFDAQQADGFCAVGGVLSTIVPSGTQLTANGNTYLITQDAGVQSYVDNVSLAFSGGIVTAVTDSEHSLSSSLEVTISGAGQSEYNGTYTITVLDENTFTYEITGSPVTNDTGTYTAEYALLNIESQETGQDKNLIAGSQLSIDVTDIDTIAYVGISGIVGGLDEEDIEDYRIRIGENHNITPGIATEPSLLSSAKSVPGNTRVFIIRPIEGDTGGTPGQPGYKPEINETVIYILRDNDESIIPSQAILDETKQQIINDGLWPNFIPDSRLYVLAPTLTLQDFSFASISPDTTTMRNSITNQLVGFYEDNADVGGTIFINDIYAFLSTVQDESTGQLLQSYSLTSPSTDTTAGSGEIFGRGDVTFG